MASAQGGLVRERNSPGATLLKLKLSLCKTLENVGCARVNSPERLQ